MEPLIIQWIFLWVSTSIQKGFQKQKEAQGSIESTLREQKINEGATLLSYSSIEKSYDSTLYDEVSYFLEEYNLLRTEYPNG